MRHPTGWWIWSRTIAKVTIGLDLATWSFFFFMVGFREPRSWQLSIGPFYVYHI